MFSGRLFQAYIIPISAFLSVSIAGGYGTGREVVEFFSRHGPWEGFYGLILSGVLVGILNALIFEIARQTSAYDYRTFMRELIGRFWVVFEVLYFALLLLVLAVVGSAAGVLIEEFTPVPQELGLLLFLAIVAILVFYGRELIERTLVVLTVFLLAAFTAYFLLALTGRFEETLNQLNGSLSPAHFDWAYTASQFALYSSVAAVLVLFATHGIQTRFEALTSGMLCGLFYVLPGLLFHVSFLPELAEITTQRVPVQWVISRMGSEPMLIGYLLALMGTFLATGSGFIQAVNERLDGWAREKLNRQLSPVTHSVVAISALLISAAVAQFGIIDLIARGYGTMAWAFMIVLVVPVLVTGVRRVLLSPE